MGGEVTAKTHCSHFMCTKTGVQSQVEYLRQKSHIPLCMASVTHSHKYHTYHSCMVSVTHGADVGSSWEDVTSSDSVAAMT
jgi:hypothetical protein